MLGQAAELGRDAFRTRTRSVRRLAQPLHRLTRRKGEAAAEALQGAYGQLIGIAAASRAQAERVRAAFDHLMPPVDRAIAQATPRVLAGEGVPAREKRLSLFEPHTQVFTRPKAGKDVEFGRRVWRDEVVCYPEQHYLTTLERLRMARQMTCPRWGGSQCIRYRSSCGHRRWRCRACGRSLGVTVGTPLFFSPHAASCDRSGDAGAPPRELARGRRADRA